MQNPNQLKLQMVGNEPMPDSICVRVSSSSCFTKTYKSVHCIELHIKSNHDLLRNQDVKGVEIATSFI